MKSQEYGILTGIFVIVTIWSTVLVDFVYHSSIINLAVFSSFSVITFIILTKCWFLALKEEDEYRRGVR